MKLILVCQAQQETTRGVVEIRRPSFLFCVFSSLLLKYLNCTIFGEAKSTHLISHPPNVFLIAVSQATHNLPPGGENGMWGQYFVPGIMQTAADKDTASQQGKTISGGFH